MWPFNPGKNVSTDFSLKNRELFFLTFTILLFIFRTALPFLKYPFILFYFSFFLYFIYSYFHRIRQTIFRFIKIFYLVFLLIGILLLSLLLSSKIYLITLKEILNSFIILSLFYPLYLVITTRYYLTLFVKYLIDFSIIFAGVISILNVINLFSPSLSNKFLSTGSPGVDYNFAILPVVFGFLGILYKLQIKDHNPGRVISNIFLLIFTFGILTSGSRRGFAVLIVLILLLTINFISHLFNRRYTAFLIARYTRVYLILLFSFIGLIYLFAFHTSSNFKDMSLQTIGVKNITITKHKIASKFHRYNPSLTYENVYKRIWTPLDPRMDPDSGWGTRKHKTIYRLSGSNVEIVPEGARGYYMDSTCSAQTWNGNAYSYTIIGNDSVTSSNIVRASVYCYVSKDFDGTWVKLKAEGSTYGNFECYYDLDDKETWQQLRIQADCKEGWAPVYLYFSKYGVNEFSSLKGHVIFAYPEYYVFERDSLLNESVSQVVEEDQEKTDILLSTQNNTNKPVSFQSIEDQLKLRLPYPEFQSTISAQFGNLIVGLMQKSLIDSLNTDIDPIRNLIARLVSEDTTYYPYSSDFQPDSSSDNVFVTRTSRWLFALNIFKDEYNWQQKILGNGFDFLNWYGFYFYSDKTRSDWPHNPFLTILLYSGILGLLFYFYFICIVVWYYFKYLENYYLLFAYFGVTFFFSFFSAGNPFDPPVMGFFVMLPFLIDGLHHKRGF